VEGVRRVLLASRSSRQSIDDSGIVCTQMVLRWCTAGTALQPSCCCPATALLLPSCCCCPAETHLTPPAGGGDMPFDMPAGKCGSDISQVWRVCASTPGRSPSTGGWSPSTGSCTGQVCYSHFLVKPVLGKCATRTFSSKRPMLREPHIKGVWPRVLARVYISLLCART
jgi:hypothetical protein